MGRKKKILAGSCVLCLLVLNVLIVCHRGSVGGNYELHLTMNSDKEQEIQVYYSAAGELSEKSSQVKTYDQVGESQELVFSVPFQFNFYGSFFCRLISFWYCPPYPEPCHGVFPACGC